MIAKVLLLAFKTNKVRLVYIPDEEAKDRDLRGLAELAFHYGQNDFQPMKVRSVSVGDIVEVRGRFFRCENIGWTLLDEVTE